jgi:hypothetical protein
VPTNKRRRLEPDELIRDLVPNPVNVPNTKMFVGLLGPANQEGYWRLYFSTELKDYLEVRDDDILLSKSLKTPENPLGGTAVWIKADADIQVTRRASEEAAAEFLTGRISANFLQSAAVSGISIGNQQIGPGGIKSIPPVESCVPALCLPPPPPPDPPGTTAVCTLSTKCRTQFLCL